MNTISLKKKFQQFKINEETPDNPHQKFPHSIYDHVKKTLRSFAYFLKGLKHSMKNVIFARKDVEALHNEYNI